MQGSLAHSNWTRALPSAQDRPLQCCSQCCWEVVVQLLPGIRLDLKLKRVDSNGTIKMACLFTFATISHRPFYILKRGVPSRTYIVMSMSWVMVAFAWPGLATFSTAGRRLNRNTSLAGQHKSFEHPNFTSYLLPHFPQHAANQHLKDLESLVHLCARVYQLWNCSPFWPCPLAQQSSREWRHPECKVQLFPEHL